MGNFNNSKFKTNEDQETTVVDDDDDEYDENQITDENEDVDKLVVTHPDYHIVETPIGHGSFAQVYAGTHLKTGERVAIKIIEKTKIPSFNRRTVFEEHLMLKSLTHPNIIKLLQYVDTPTYLVMFFPLMTLGDLHTYILHNGPMAEAKALHVFAQLVEAVKYCHERNIVHRDIKLENILIEVAHGKIYIKLIDFGFSVKSATSRALFFDHPGSPAYASPELIQGLPYDGQPCDIWSMGICLYTMLTKTFPFYRKCPRETKHHICYVEVKFLEQWNISLQTRKLIYGMLSKEPIMRPSIFEVQKIFSK